MLRGGCLCGALRYEIDVPLGPIVLCHCGSCRRASGSAFAANASLRADGFRWLAGREALVEHESSPGKTRAFCRACGSPLYSAHVSRPGELRVRLGTLDAGADPGAGPAAHIWVGEKAPWHEIHDDLPRFDAEPPEALVAPG